ncbi:putative mitochondrial protein, partial [Mucuna pruriens]
MPFFMTNVKRKSIWTNLLVRGSLDLFSRFIGLCMGLNNLHEFGKCLIVYVDDIVITGNGAKISQLKKYLFSHFQMKDLGSLKYFLVIEVAQLKDKIVISQRKYVLGILKETSMIDYRLVDSPRDPNIKLTSDQGDPYLDLERYQRLGRKLIYLTITRPNISFAIGVVSQFLQAPHTNYHSDLMVHILKYIKKDPGQGLLYEDKGNTQVTNYCGVDWVESPIDRCFTTWYCIFIGDNIVSWKSKKQIVVAHSSAEA